MLKGAVDGFGKVNCFYCYVPLQGKGRTLRIERELWASTGATTESEGEENDAKPKCGPFQFEIRVWDLDKEAETFREISQRFNLNLVTLRKKIKGYLGLSLYRDGILVLPKSEAAKDWLGLDLRRVSKYGTRISTSQIVGYLAVTAEHNSEIKDTSDRERLVDNPATRDLKTLLWQIAGILENERSKDKQEIKKERPFKELFASLSTKPLIERMSVAIAQGIEAKDLLPLVEDHELEVEKAVGEIEQRLIYYSRLASLGVLAAMLVHEVGNNTFVIGGLTRRLRKMLEKDDVSIRAIEKDLELAEKSIRALERLADTLTPLASRKFRTRRRDSILEDEIQHCLDAHEKEIINKKVLVEWQSASVTKVAVDPGELLGIINNLIDNSLHWLSYVKDRPRRIVIQVSIRQKSERAYVQVHDSGPGIQDGDEERIFWPGVTQKSEGFGMGLVVASELVAKHGGRLHLIKPGEVGGASFGFDLPLSEERK